MIQAGLEFTEEFRLASIMKSLAYRSQKRAFDLLLLRLQTVVSTMWVLKTKTRSSGKAASTLNHRAISSSPNRYSFSLYLSQYLNNSHLEKGPSGDQ